jgi:hypothetical protein
MASETTSYDGGKTWQNITHHVLLGQYYFLDTEMIIHSRQVYTWWKLISDFGGLFDVLFICLFFLIHKINDNLLVDKIIKNLYVTQDSKTI